jgi:hypothetical protein
MLIRFLPLPLLSFLVACDPAPPPMQATGSDRLPPQFCKKVREGLEKSSGPGGAEFSETGEGTVMEAAWQTMDSSQRDALARALAYHAACARGGGASEQEVIIRSDSGNVLMRRTIDTRVDMGEMMGGDEGP